MKLAWLCLLVVACERHESATPPPTQAPTPSPIAIDAAVIAPDAAAVAPPPAPSSSSPTREHIAAGMHGVCARTPTNGLACWGTGFENRVTPMAGFTDVAGVALGQAKICARTTKGAVYCNDGGPAAKVDTSEDVVQIAGDPDAFVICARKSSGTVACWSDFDKPARVHDTVGVTGAKDLAVGGTTACILDDAGVACWKTYEPKPKLVRIPEAVGATRLAGGRHKLIALRAGKPPVTWTEEYKLIAMPQLGTDIVQIAQGGDETCALSRDRVQCWDTMDPKTLHDVQGLGPAREIAVGYGVACALVGDKSMCWGEVGSLGNGMEPFTTEPTTLVNGLVDAVAISTNDNSPTTCARRATGTTVCWGGATHADPVPVESTTTKLPDCTKPGACPRVWSGGWQRGDWTCREKKTHISCTMKFYERHGEGTSEGPEESWGNLDGARDIRMPGNMHDNVCVADASGSVSCFPAFIGAKDAVVVDGVADVIQLAGSGEETCAVEKSGTVKCWNERERANVGGKVRTVKTQGEVVEIAGGEVHFCVRYKNGTVGCWGMRSILGDGADDHQRSAIVVPGVTVAP